MATQAQPAFQLIGGHPVLDFSNTLDNRGSENEIELLASYDDLLRFGEQSGIISSAESSELSRAAQKHKQLAARALADATVMRETIFEVFNAVSLDQVPPKSAVDRLNSYIEEALAHRHITPVHNRFQWQWSDTADNPRWILWPIALQAAELLSSEDVQNVRSCASEGCDWLFLDHSKSHSRRWCDMKVCGNRNKARRFYQKQKL
jgi:predicted RNA-binding Zn ribbon-like protein